MKDLDGSMHFVGLSKLLGSLLAKPTYMEFQDPNKESLKKPLGFFARLWHLIKNPYSYFAYLGCWKRGQIDPKTGRKNLKLEDLARHGAIEHDISITRRDVGQQQGNNAPQQDLIHDLLACSSDGEVITTEDFGRFIKRRIRQQLADNPTLVYTPYGHQSNCSNIAMMMHCFGNGKSIPCSYVRAIFVDERLPWDEGWRKRNWWTLGIFEFFRAKDKIQAAIGLSF